MRLPYILAENKFASYKLHNLMKVGSDICEVGSALSLSSICCNILKDSSISKF